MLKTSRLPPKGSFSTAYSSLSRKSVEDLPGLSIDQANSAEEVDLSQELSEMCSFAQMALKQTSEVQEDISKLLNLWERRETGQEEVNELNNLLLKNGFSALPELLDVRSLLQVIRQVLSDFKSLKKQLTEMHSRNSGLEQTLRSCQESLNSYNCEVQSLKVQIKELTRKTPTKKLQHPGVFSKSPQKTQNEIISNLMKILACSKTEELPDKLKSVEVVLRLAPKLEKFVSEICKEFVPELDYETDSLVFVTALKQVFERIHAFKSVLQDLINFKVAVFDCFGAGFDKKEDVLNDLKCLLKFREEVGGNSIIHELKQWKDYLKSTRDILEKVLGLFGVKNAFTDLQFRETILKHLKKYPI